MLPALDAAMSRFLLVTLAFLGAFVATWGVTVGVYILATSVGWVVDRDGGIAMGTFFVMGPAFGFVLGLVAAVVVGVRLGRGPRSG